MDKSLKKHFIIFVLPTLIAFFIAFVIPFIMGVYLSFCKFTTVSNATFIGMDNYKKAFSDGTFIQSVIFTVKFAVVSVILINVFAFILALALTRKMRGTNLFRTVFFMPNLIGGIILGYLWQSLLNALLFSSGTTLVANERYGFWGLVILMNWQLIGYMMIIYIAGLQNVPLDMLEAAKIDGASSMKSLFRVKIPLVMPSITICLFLTVSNSFKLFDQNLALTGGAPSRKTAMMALDIYQTFYGRVGFQGVGQAKAVVFFLIVALISFIQLASTRRREVEY